MLQRTFGTQPRPFIHGTSIEPLSFLIGDPILSVPFVGRDAVEPRPFSLQRTVQSLDCVIELRSSLLGDSILSFTFLGCNR